ncbi:MAG: hypothetical protein ACTHKA_28965 [Anaerocolumna jejuensis]
MNTESLYLRITRDIKAGSNKAGREATLRLSCLLFYCILVIQNTSHAPGNQLAALINNSGSIHRL